MASLVRQPFAPLDGSRLHNLSSIKNRQNAVISNSGPTKRKAVDDFDPADSENVNPLQSPKRAKGSPSSSKDFKSTSYYHVITKPPPALHTTTSLGQHPTKLTVLPTPPLSSAAPLSSVSRARPVLQPRSAAARRPAGVSKPSPLSNVTPAGRSPPRASKRAGILSRRRAPGSDSSLSPPTFRLGGHHASPFSLEAALKGTIPTYKSAKPSVASPASPLAAAAAAAAFSSTADPSALPRNGEDDMKASWFFDIHEDTPEQEMTNMLQHGTCALDISSDEESEHKATVEKAEGRDKENIPPADDVSQTSTRRNLPAAAASPVDDMDFVKERRALGDLNVEDYYAAGCDQASVFVVPADEDDEAERQEQSPEHEQSSEQQQVPEPGLEMQSIDELVMRREAAPAEAAALQPMENTGDAFDLWESGSSKGDDGY